MKLDPCPFCGSKFTRVAGDPDWDGRHGECVTCDAKSGGPSDQSDQEAADRWNKRSCTDCVEKESLISKITALFNRVNGIGLPCMSDIRDLGTILARRK